VLGCDVADATSTEAAIERFVYHAGGLDLLVTNAGVTHYGRSAISRSRRLCR
jgi:NAD(P)-dependent dehydrogenase (short-subunit alcohol dehydrogenase family)